jgi:hypothetical protein
VRRRDFFKIFAGAAASWPLVASAQQRPPKIPRIGIIDDAPFWDTSKAAMSQLNIGRLEVSPTD